MKISNRFLTMICFLLTISLILLICGCRIKPRPPVHTEEIMRAMLAAIPHPEGRLVLFNSEMIGDPDKKALLTALYGELAAAWFDGEKQPILDEGCLFLSETQHPFEVAVFRCIHEGDVQGGSSSVLGICAQRKAYITDAWQGSEYEDVTAGAVVTCIGAYVILAVSKDTDTAIRAAEKLIS